MPGLKVTQQACSISRICPIVEWSRVYVVIDNIVGWPIKVNKRCCVALKCSIDIVYKYISLKQFEADIFLYPGISYFVANNFIYSYVNYVTSKWYIYWFLNHHPKCKLASRNNGPRWFGKKRMIHMYLSINEYQMFHHWLQCSFFWSLCIHMNCINYSRVHADWIKC